MFSTISSFSGTFSAGKKPVRIIASVVPSFENPSLTLGSAVTVESQSPFVGGGNSYLFSSSVDSYISTPGSSDWALGTGDFTVEWFSYQTTLTQFQRVFTVSDYPSIDVGVSIGGVYQRIDIEPCLHPAITYIEINPGSDDRYEAFNLRWTYQATNYTDWPSFVFFLDVARLGGGFRCKRTTIYKPSNLNNGGELLYNFTS